MKRRLSCTGPLMVLAGGLALSPLAAPGATADKFTLPPYTTHKLENGATLLLMERHQLPLVSFVWIMKSGGGIYDPDGHEGLASLTAQLLRKGTKTRSAQQISEELDFVGASFDGGAARDYASGSAEFVSKDLDLAVALLADLLINPVFPADEVAKLVQQEVDGIAEAKEVPNQVLGRYFQGLLFGTHPYARPVGGTEATLPQITREQIITFHQEHYVPGQLILAVAGDFNAANPSDSSSPQDISLSEKKPMHQGSPAVRSTRELAARCTSGLKAGSKTSGNLPQYPSLPSMWRAPWVPMASVYGVRRRRRVGSSDQLPMVLRPQARSR